MPRGQSFLPKFALVNNHQNTTCIVELHYLPCIQYFSLFFKYDEIYIEKHEHYRKGSYRNRCYIGSGTGRQMLSVPLLKGKHQQMPITDVRIAYHTAWHAQHWHAIQTAYGKAPFYAHYADPIREILYRRFDFLYALNMTLLAWLMRETSATGQLLETSEYEQVGSATTALHDSITPSSAFHHHKYNQVFMDRRDFIENLSVLDLLMHMGPESHRYLKGIDSLS